MSRIPVCIMPIKGLQRDVRDTTGYLLSELILTPEWEEIKS